VFYEMLAGGSAPELSRWGVAGTCVADFWYLSQSGCDIRRDGVSDGEAFTGMVRAMEVVGFSPADRAALFDVVAAVLHLGNLDFVPALLAAAPSASAGGGGSCGAELKFSERPSLLQRASSISLLRRASVSALETGPAADRPAGCAAGAAPSVRPSLTAQSSLTLGLGEGEDGSDGSEIAGPSLGALAAAARLLCVDEGALEAALCSRASQAGREWYTVRLSPLQVQPPPAGRPAGCLPAGR
jgi:hypothetical protein